MLSKKEVQFIRSLKLKKYRQLHHTFIAEGEKWLNEILKVHYPVQHIYTIEESIFKKIASYPIYEGKVTLINEKTLQKISQLKTPNKVLCLLKMSKSTLNDSDLSKHINIVCDDISDPGNMGTIIRTACWFGYPQIICSPNCVDIYNPKVVQSTMGTMLKVNICSMPLLNLFEQKYDIPLYATSLQGKSLQQIGTPSNGFLVIGNESKGVRPTILDKAHHLIKIEGSGQAESLNASVAAGVLMFAFKK